MVTALKLLGKKASLLNELIAEIRGPVLHSHNDRQV